jgi:hypothetical protein
MPGRTYARAHGLAVSHSGGQKVMRMLRGIVRRGGLTALPID